MKNLLLILFCLSTPFFITAQETVKQKEVGLSFHNLDNFGIAFKTGTAKALWRFNTLFISGGERDEISDSSEFKQSSSGFGVGFGRENRKEIGKNIELRYGIDLFFSYSKSLFDNNSKRVNYYDLLQEIETYRQGINLVFGFNYVINESIVLGAELLPSLYYVTGTSIVKRDDNYNGEQVDESDITGFEYGLSNNSARLSVSYRF